MRVTEGAGDGGEEKRVGLKSKDYESERVGD